MRGLAGRPFAAVRGAAELAGLIARREISSVEAVTEALARVDSCNALATRLDESALAVAAERDRSAPIGPLHGVPVTVKTSLDLAGSPTTSGVVSRAASIPSVTGPEALGYVQAGAVVVGRGNAPDFSLRLHTDNDLHGSTLNPRDASRSPGGSGGGEAVAVALGLSALGLGGDVGGSLRVPAQWNGVMALKATPGRIPSSESGLALALMTSFGPFARSVEDLRLGYGALARADRRDPWGVPSFVQRGSARRGGAQRGAAPGAATAGGATPGGVTPGGVTLGGVTAGEATAGGGVSPWTAADVVDHAPHVIVLDPPDAEPAVREDVRRAARALADAGYELSDDAPAGIDDIPDLWARLFLTEVFADWEALSPVISADCRRWLEDAFVVRPPLETSAELIEAFRERHALAAAWPSALVLAPVMTIGAPAVGFDLAGPAALGELFSAARYCWAANVLGLPAVALRGVQLIGPRFAESWCLNAAELVQTRVDP